MKRYLICPNDLLPAPKECGWAQDPVIGPMYGPAYFVGTKVLRDAVAKVGAKRVAEVGLQTTGRLSNIITFQEQVSIVR
jgi:hypothetical protein